MHKTEKEFPVILFLLSFLVLTVQIVLSAFLRVYLKLPFLSITFAFLGLSSAGVYAFWKYKNVPAAEMLKRIPSFIHTFGVLLFFYFTVIAIALLSLQASNSMEAVFNYQETGVLAFDRSLRDIIILSGITGVYFSICFFYLGLVISIIYKIFSAQATRFYYFDLTGAAAGCILGSLLMSWFDLYPIALFLTLVCFAMALYLKNRYGYSKFSKLSSLVFLILSIVIMTFYARGNVFSNRSTVFRELWSGWNIYSRVSLIEESGKNNLKYKFLIDNGAGIAHLDAFDPEQPFRYKLFEEFSATSLGFLIDQPRDILILMAGAGKDMLEAYSYSAGTADITGVELNPLIVNKAVSLPEFHLKEFFALENVHMVVQEGRQFLETQKKRYDTVIFSWSGSPVNNYLGVNANSAQFLYTKEAFKRVLSVLKPDGTIVIVNGNKLRTIAVLRQAFAESGVADISDHFTLVTARELLKNDTIYREMLTPFDNAYLVVKKSGFSKNDIDRLSGHIKMMGLASIYTPHYDIERNTPLQKSVHDVITDIVKSVDFSGVLHRLSLDLKFNLTLITDDKPFIGNYFYIYSFADKTFWSFIKNDLSSIYNQHYSFHLYMMGFIFCIIAFVAAAIAVIFRLNRKDIVFSRDLPFFIYFSAIGFAFMLVEISLLNQFVLYLANPIYALSVILAGLLFSLGLGSYLSDAVLKNMKISLKSTVLICIVLLLLGYFFLPVLIEQTLGRPMAVKLCFVFLCILPLGLFLGILFPQGLKKLGQTSNHLVPLAWGLNGYMSVIGSAASVYLSTIVGFKCFLLIAAGVYSCILFIPLTKKEPRPSS
ncbi:MAG: hypothetical protein AB7S78_02895 [Candidatus Omnitrophota bacterium]